MIIRPAKHEDRNGVLQIIRQSGVFNEKEINIALQVFDDSIQQAEREEYMAFCACDENEDPLGYICFGPINVTYGSYDLYWIAVTQNLRRRGVGKRLLVFMEEYLLKVNARRVYVDTSSTQAYESARSFYEKHGYRLACTLEDFYQKGDHRIIYMKEIKEDACRNIELGAIGQDSLSYR
jgi:GNAT superfamily N-acetyltransferase